MNSIFEQAYKEAMSLNEDHMEEVGGQLDRFSGWLNNVTNGKLGSAAAGMRYDANQASNSSAAQKFFGVHGKQGAELNKAVNDRIMNNAYNSTQQPATNAAPEQTIPTNTEQPTAQNPIEAPAETPANVAATPDATAQQTQDLNAIASDHNVAQAAVQGQAAEFNSTEQAATPEAPVDNTQPEASAENNAQPEAPVDANGQETPSESSAEAPEVPAETAGENPENTAPVESTPTQGEGADKPSGIDPNMSNEIAKEVIKLIGNEAFKQQAEAGNWDAILAAMQSKVNESISSQTYTKVLRETKKSDLQNALVNDQNFMNSYRDESTGVKAAFEAFRTSKPADRETALNALIDTYKKASNSDENSSAALKALTDHVAVAKQAVSDSKRYALSKQQQQVIGPLVNAVKNISSGKGTKADDIAIAGAVNATNDEGLKNKVNAALAQAYIAEK